MPAVDISSVVDTEQEHLLENALQVVKAESFEMKRCLDKNELMEGLRHASLMLSELRTSFLTPKFYYRLYIDVTSELHHFISYLKDAYLSEDRSRKVADLYETVQYTGNVIPRLYLLITVGIVYIKSDEASVKDVLFDLVEMCRGVQHPLRGLFLRNYLLTSTKELLPDESNGLFGNGGSISDAVDFIMTNFSEMNKLWVRMQHLGPSKEKSKRERERRELRILVGTNLVRLSQLECLDLETYKKVVLPGILEQSVSCKEPISQEYLMECVIQVFPDSYHLNTLHEFLDACAELHPDVHIKNVLGTLIEHLTQYASADESPGIPSDINLFEIFSQHAQQVVGARAEIPTEDVISIQIALLNLALNCYADRSDFANTVYSSTFVLLKDLKLTNFLFNSVIGRELVKLLKIPFDHYKEITRLLDLPSYADVLSLLEFRGRTHICSTFISNMLENETRIEDENRMEMVFSLINALVVDQPDQPKDISAHSEFSDEQNLVGKLVHLVYNDDPEVHYKLLNKARKHFGTGGKLRLCYTLPPTIFCAFSLILRFAEDREMKDFDAKIGKLFHFCVSTINALKMQAEMPETALRLYLQGALLSDKINFDKSAEMAYEFVAKAFAIYEEDISESREQVQTLTLLIATIQQLRQLTDDSHEPLRNQCALYATKLIKRPDQASLVCLSARLFWFSKVKSSNEYVHDGKRVAECLKKAIKISSQCMEDVVQLTLYINTLADYFYFYEEGCDTIVPETVNQVLEKIRDLLLQLDPSPEADHLNNTFSNLINRIREYQRNPPAHCKLPYDGFVL